MGRLIAIYDELRDVQGELGRLENVIVAHPEYGSLQVDYMSLKKKHNILKLELEKASNEEHTDVVTYRIIPPDLGRLSLQALTSSLETFQWGISTVFDALETEPKKRGRISDKNVELSSFEFAYVFSGSVGVVLTIPNERLLFGDSKLDEAIGHFFVAARARNRSDIEEFSQICGVPSVRRLYEWAQANTRHETSVDVLWRRKDQLRERLLIETHTLRGLQKIIEETSEIEEEAVEISGFLVGLDTSLETFHIIASEAGDIRGQWSEEFSYSDDLVLKQPYIAKLLRRSITYYAYEKQETTWSLISLSKEKSNGEE